MNYILRNVSIFSGVKVKNKVGRAEMAKKFEKLLRRFRKHCSI